MSDPKLRKLISSTFKLHGFTLRSDSCSFLVDQLAPLPSEEHEEWIDKLIDHVQNQRLSSAVIEINAVELAVKDCAQEHHEVAEDVFCVINAFDIPRFVYNVDLKKYETSETPVHAHSRLFAEADAKANMFRNRFLLLKQLTERHPLFKPSTDKSSDTGDKFKIYPIDHLLSSAKKLTKIITMGVFSQLKIGSYHLEDPTGIVELDLSETSYHTGLHCDNCIVLAEGWYEDKVFHANAIGFPPAETSATSRAYLGNLNMFGGDAKFNFKSSPTLIKALEDTKDKIMVFLSDVWLDQDKVMRKLQLLFHGYSTFPPIAFVFMGTFLSCKQSSSQVYQLKNHFKALGDMIATYPSLVQQSKFVFVPGPTDPACANILPRPAIPKVIWEEFERRVPGAIFTSNPCRIRYCTQEIVILREDIMSKLCRNTVHYPSTGSINEHFAKTLLCQAHLSPLPLSVRPVYWSYEHALHLYPAPDLVVVGDTLNTFIAEHAECQVTNPGSFAKNKFTFIAYCPGTKQIEESQIDDDL